MKPSFNTTGISLLIVLSLLVGCSGTPQDEVLPTLAVLPSLTPNASPVLAETVTPQPTELATKTVDETVGETPQTPDEISLPSPLDPNPTPTSESDFGFTQYPNVLQVGEQLTLEGVLTTQDVDSGQAVLTNTAGKTVTLLLDPFTAIMGNNQRVQITGIVEAQPNSVENAIRVNAINLLDATAQPSNVGDPLAEGLITVTPDSP